MSGFEQQERQFGQILWVILLLMGNLPIWKFLSEISCKEFHTENIHVIVSILLEEFMKLAMKVTYNSMAIDHRSTNIFIDFIENPFQNQIRELSDWWFVILKDIIKDKVISRQNIEDFFFSEAMSWN